ncbi:MAG: hypothetical protein AB8G05_13355 [Oligoflexales bacterium]
MLFGKLLSGLLFTGVAMNPISHGAADNSFDIEVDSGKIRIEFSDSISEPKLSIQNNMCAFPPKVVHSSNKISVKAAEGCKQWTNLSFSLPTFSSVNLAVGAGNIEVDHSEWVAKEYKVDTTVGNGNITSITGKIRISKLMMSSFAESKSNGGDFSVTLGAGSVIFN